MIIKLIMNFLTIIYFIEVTVGTRTRNCNAFSNCNARSRKGVRVSERKQYQQATDVYSMDEVALKQAWENKNDENFKAIQKEVASLVKKPELEIDSAKAVSIAILDERSANRKFQSNLHSAHIIHIRFSVVVCINITMM